MVTVVTIVAGVATLPGNVPREGVRDEKEDEGGGGGGGGGGGRGGGGSKRKPRRLLGAGIRILVRGVCLTRHTQSSPHGEMERGHRTG